MNNISFETKRVLLRKPSLSDAQDIFNNYARDPDVVRYLIWSIHNNISVTQDFINQCISEWNSAKAFPFVIISRDTYEVIGMIDFRIDNFKANLGYVLARSYWNQGIMTEALQPAFDWIFNINFIQRIQAFHDIDNPASGKVMSKIGMQYEGILRNWIIHPNISNKPRDCKVYSKIK